jgi:hypothetical protein
LRNHSFSTILSRGKKNVQISETRESLSWVRGKEGIGYHARFQAFPYNFCFLSTGTDILPAELPRESSDHFGSAVITVLNQLIEKQTEDDVSLSQASMDLQNGPPLLVSWRFQQPPIGLAPAILTNLAYCFFSVQRLYHHKQRRSGSPISVFGFPLASYEAIKGGGKDSETRRTTQWSLVSKATEIAFLLIFGLFSRTSHFHAMQI